MATKQRILVIDDDKVVSQMIILLFERVGYEVFSAADGPEGLTKVDQVKPDLIILDLMMPQMNGLEVCKHLRRSPATAWLPIIMLSAKEDVDTKVTGFQAGVDDYVQKPVAPKELLARAEALLQRTRRARAPTAHIIAVVGAKGGVGVTTVAVNVATVLASQSKAVILTELRPHHGTVMHNLNLAPAQDLGRLLMLDPAQIDRTDVTRRLVRHKSGLRVLVAPQRATDYPLTEAHVEVITELLSREADYLILDLPVVAGEAMREALAQADQILLVTEPETASVACARVDLDTLKDWGLFERVNLVVVSRARSNMPTSPKEIEAQLNLPVMAVIPPAPEVFQVVVGLGNPVVLARPTELVATALAKLAQEVEQG
ncbi:MAG: response regulator [Chloroflexota bacterium]